MKARNAILAVLAVTVVIALFLANRQPGPSPATSEPATSGGTQSAPVAPTGSLKAAPQERVPPYHPSAEAARPLPKTLPASQFALPVVARAYGIAERIPTVLAQQPCYCWCDKFGHGSLLDCYKTDHGAGWAICVKEVLLADRMTREGKTPAQIREAIIRGDWQTVDLGGGQQ